MTALTRRDIIKIDRTIIIAPSDSSEMVASLPVPSLAIVGESDYVGTPSLADTTVVPGGHVSPLEAPDQVLMMINRLIGGDL